MKDSKRAKALQKIESQIDLEILLKHDELRLIEQELAKCQVALEQLRRCEVIPYPTESGSPLSSVDVRSGTGASLQPAAGYTTPVSPAPWGVTDGPYTRHYRRWLLSDSAFDSVPETQYGMESRSMRASIAERPSFGSSRSQRYATSSKYQAIPGAFPPPKDRNQPLLLKRADGTWVKLICKWCQKDNISSVQGFLNHCRIAHSHNYASHEQAAADCGHALDGDEANNVATPATPAVMTPIPASSGSFPVTARHNIHPLVSGQATTTGISAAGVQTAKSTPVKPFAKKPTTKSAPGSSSKPRPSALTSSFVASPLTPHLSSYFEKKGLSLDLKQAVTAAKVKCDIESIEPLVKEDDNEQSISRKAGPQSSGVRVPQAGDKSVGPGKQTSFSAARNFGQRIIIPTAVSSSNHASQFYTPDSEPASFMRNIPADEAPDRMNMSPRTVDSNPGMISDREDDEEIDHRFDSDHDMPLADSRSVDDLKFHVHNQDDGDTNMHASTPCSAMPHENMFAPTHDATTPSQPPKKKRGRPSKKDKALQQQQQQLLQRQQAAQQQQQPSMP